jgi:hypothetical protein
VKKTTTSASAAVSDLAPRRGRPRKFNAPSRAVTLTLPEQVLGTLSAVDPDVSRAIVRLTHREAARRPLLPAELVRFGRRAVIVVSPTRTLEERTGVFLVPIPDGRALMSFDDSITVATLELKVRDALDDKKLSVEDRRIFQSVHEVLKAARTGEEVVLHERKIIVLESRPRRNRNGSAGSRRSG